MNSLQQKGSFLSLFYDEISAEIAKSSVFGNYHDLNVILKDWIMRHGVNAVNKNLNEFLNRIKTDYDTLVRDRTLEKNIYFGTVSCGKRNFDMLFQPVIVIDFVKWSNVKTYSIERIYKILYNNSSDI